MAPDLDSLKVDYSTPGSEGYAIPDIVYNVNLVASLEQG